ncbi:MAG TPA: RyR domain-containing protein [Symbiobacteriaceae bacterium]|nr:RyR domain-containing protein [Symbiobacteriaceae bacterium]
MAYEPRPLDTSGVTLSDEILRLTELLAENTHEVWAAQRMSEGWRYGLVRDDARKENPCLVPYAELPEQEKEYDRQTAMQALKVISALGYRVTRG